MIDSLIASGLDPFALLVFICAAIFVAVILLQAPYRRCRAFWRRWRTRAYMQRETACAAAHEPARPVACMAYPRSTAAGTARVVSFSEGSRRVHQAASAAAGSPYREGGADARRALRLIDPDSCLATTTLERQGVTVRVRPTIHGIDEIA